MFLNFVFVFVRIKFKKHIIHFTSLAVIHKKLTDWFSVKNGVRQGCVLSSTLFLVAIDWLMRKTIGNKRRGIRWTLMSLLEELDFADDVALVSSTRDQLRRKHQTSR